MPAEPSATQQNTKISPGWLAAPWTGSQLIESRYQCPLSTNQPPKKTSKVDTLSLSLSTPANYWVTASGQKVLEKVVPHNDSLEPSPRHGSTLHKLRYFNLLQRYTFVNDTYFYRPPVRFYTQTPKKTHQHIKTLQIHTAQSPLIINAAR